MPKRDRGYFRKQRLKSIKKRRRLIKEQKYAGAYRGKWIDESEFESGILAKGHNGWLGRGGAAEKTNMRKAHANARNGPGDNYKRHDKQQVIDCKQQEREWSSKEDGKREKESFDCNLCKE